MGGRGDSWAKCIAHKQGNKVIVDLIRAWPPGMSVHDIAKESAEVRKAYGLKSTVGDNYAGEWPREAFAEHGVTYEQCEQSKSDLYLAAIPLMSSRRVELQPGGFEPSSHLVGGSANIFSIRVSKLL